MEDDPSERLKRERTELEVASQIARGALTPAQIQEGQEIIKTLQVNVSIAEAYRIALERKG